MVLDPERAQRLAEHMVRGRTGLMPFGPEGPICIVEQGIYTLSWSATGRKPLAKAAPASVIMDFDYVSTERRTGETHAEVTVNPADPVDPLMQYRTRLNLTSLRSRSDLAKQLEARVASGLDWNRMLDQAVQWVMGSHRVGEPIVNLPDAEEPDGTGVSPLPPILAADGSTIIFGDGGASKSFLALAIAASLQSGFDVIPQIEPAKTMRVGYLDWEWSAYVHKRRLRQLMGESPMPAIKYVPCRLSLKEERDRLRRAIREHSLEFLVLDSVALAAGGEPESAEVAVQFFSILRELGVPTLLIAHVTNAAAKGHADRPFGSAFWHNSARSTWYLKRSDEATAGGLTVALYHRKANDAPLSPAIGLRWHHDEGRTWVEQVSINEEPSLESELPTGRRIGLLLKKQPMTIHAIAEELGMSTDAVRMALQRGRGTRFTHLPGKSGEPATWANAQQEAA